MVSFDAASRLGHVHGGALWRKMVSLQLGNFWHFPKTMAEVQGTGNLHVFPFETEALIVHVAARLLRQTQIIQFYSFLFGILNLR